VIEVLPKAFDYQLQDYLKVLHTAKEPDVFDPALLLLLLQKQWNAVFFLINKIYFLCFYSHLFR